MIEQTLIVLKPDAVERNLIGQILSRFEKSNFKIVKLQKLNYTKEMAQTFYSAHKEKPFFGELVSYITSGPVVAAVLEGENVIEKTRQINGATDPKKAEKGTIRGDYGIGITNNTIHASDSPQSFEKEVKVVFP
ncbi:MAG TPA: nucleoside-diphosphate kinase [Nitrosopumilaceae archaeon]|nr:nucleoside-diphosphate kinase [Nitrosopumilaceae archaeon]